MCGKEKGCSGARIWVGWRLCRGRGLGGVNRDGQPRFFSDIVLNCSLTNAKNKQKKKVVLKNFKTIVLKIYLFKTF